MSRISSPIYALLALFTVLILLALHSIDTLANVQQNEESLVRINLLEEYDDFFDTYKEKISELERSLEDERIKAEVCEFLNENLREELDDMLGNISMQKFKERLSFAVKYNPNLESFLDTESYRYSLSSETKRKVRELTDEESYKNTVENIKKWVKDNIRYTYNHRWYTAKETWNEREANCNGISFLVCGMMREAGVPCKVVANTEHAWVEYLYVDGKGRFIWSVWDQGNSGYSVLNSNVYENDL
jgi:transglutaminase-like putative cysteine protease